jgi:TM2 domain-containing membrane protein YozV
MVKIKLQKSRKEKNTALLLAILGIFGVAGIHRFYTNKIGTGILWLITFGWCYIGTIVDIVMIANGTFKDKSGNFLKE